MASGAIPANGETKEHGAFQLAADTSGETSKSELTPSLSRRELLVLRGVTEGASNKVIALKLVITELTVKVHMKAILRSFVAEPYAGRNVGAQSYQRRCVDWFIEFRTQRGERKTAQYGRFALV